MFLSVRTVDSKINTIIGTSVITIELFNMYLEKLGNNQSYFKYSNYVRRKTFVIDDKVFP